MAAANTNPGSNTDFRQNERQETCIFLLAELKFLATYLNSSKTALVIALTPVLIVRSATGIIIGE